MLESINSKKTIVGTGKKGSLDFGTNKNKIELPTMHDHLGFGYYAIVSLILRINMSKCVLYILIGPLLSMTLMPFISGISNCGATADPSLSESVTEAQCRGSCLLKYTQIASSRDDSCMKNPDCYMCWSICHLLQGDSPARSSLCSDRAACFPGCRTACNFYEFLPSQNLTPPLLHDLPPLPALMYPPRLSRDGQLVWDTPKWPEGGFSPTNEEVVMYIIMTNMGGQWHQHIQTSSNNVRISKKLRNSGIRVLAVTSKGLAAYSEFLDWNDTVSDVVPPKLHSEIGTLEDSAATPSSGRVISVSSTTHKTNLFVDSNEGHAKESSNSDFHRSNETADNSLDKKYSYDYLQEDLESQPPSVTVDHSWMVNLTLKSVDLLASVEVMWDIRGSGPVDYLVTWTESTGGISGHLVSQQNVADISLWKGQQYSIQIELLDQYGNSVLRSIPRTISFSPSNSVPTIKTQSPEPFLRRKPTASSTTVRSSFTDSSLIARRVKEEFIVVKGEDDEDSGWRNKEGRNSPNESWSNREPPQNSRELIQGNDATYPDETLLEDVTSRYWNDLKKRGNNLRNSGDSFVTSQKIKNSETTSDEPQSSSLLVWAACLGVGAVIISILIFLAIRTLKRNNSTKRQEICPAEDYLSETTASSVNSSSITTTSQLTRSQCSRPDEEQWTYESVYGVANQPTAKIMLQRHPPPPPPIPLSSPPQTSIHLHHPANTHYHHGHHHHYPYHHSHPLQASASISPGRIDNASMIENYILSLDPSPVVKQVAY